FQIIETLDVGITACQHGEDFALQREDRTDVIHRAFVLERLEAFHRLVLMVGLHDAEVELAAAQAVDVGYAATAGGGVALQIFGVTVDEAADRLPRHVIDAGLTPSADGDELLFRVSNTIKTSPRQCGRKYPCQGFALHGSTPLLVVLELP